MFLFFSSTSTGVLAAVFSGMHVLLMTKSALDESPASWLQVASGKRGELKTASASGISFVYLLLSFYLFLLLLVLLVLRRLFYIC